ncbi:hypothetical protein [Phytohabitans rumicis]|uniref:Uncharacterized protein n=1 Tax=Phytohabitans rumicis TaxID=1076125 RepID=A0A6V8LAA9_9ACTN|nr:hypothetical protein [Phytohabitans rumicis]GFJ92540.1 hypothetical protein Prum_061820 [Phytohabitans rumicis]
MIKASVNDLDALAARSPSELAMYLRAQRWQTVRQDDAAVRWVKIVGGDEYEVVQPIESGIRDYAARVRDVVQVLALAEDRSELDVLRAISSVSTDVHLVRLFPADEDPGMIGLDDGVQAYENLRNLVVAAAYSVSAKQPRAVQPARKPADVLHYLRGVRIGPSAEGSFVLSVHTAVPPRLTAEPGEDATPEPFERQVSLRIYEAARAAQEAATAALAGADGLDVFNRSVTRGVSANLCEALVGLGGDARHPVELRLALAAARPTARSFVPVRFRRDHLAVLESAAHEFRARSAEEDSVVAGNVVRLYREASATGEVSIAGTVEGDDRLRRIWVELAGVDYETAVRAHQEMLQVSVRGDIVRRGTRSYLTRPSGFQILPDPSDQ